MVVWNMIFLFIFSAQIYRFWDFITIKGTESKPQQLITIDNLVKVDLRQNKLDRTIFDVMPPTASLQQVAESGMEAVIESGETKALKTIHVQGIFTDGLRRFAFVKVNRDQNDTESEKIIKGSIVASYEVDAIEPRAIRLKDYDQGDMFELKVFSLIHQGETDKKAPKSTINNDRSGSKEGIHNQSGKTKRPNRQSGETLMKSPPPASKGDRKSIKTDRQQPSDSKKNLNQKNKGQIPSKGQKSNK